MLLKGLPLLKENKCLGCMCRDEGVQLKGLDEGFRQRAIEGDVSLAPWMFWVGVVFVGDERREGVDITSLEAVFLFMDDEGSLAF